MTGCITRNYPFNLFIEVTIAEVGTKWLKTCHIIRKSFKVEAVQTATLRQGTDAAQYRPS